MEDGGGMEEGWRRDGGGMEEGWRMEEGGRIITKISVSEYHINKILLCQNI